MVLDIDVDYYLSPRDDVWQDPLALSAHLQHFRPTALTVAYSVQGGYTPVRHRYLGPLTVLALSEPALAQDLLEKFQSLQPTLVKEQPEWSREQPIWVQAAAAALSGDLERAASLESGYRVQPIDKVSAAMLRHQYPLARHHLQNVSDPLESHYMKGMLAFREQNFNLAADTWSEMLDRESLEPRTLIYLLIFCGRAFAAAGRDKEALERFQQAREVDSTDSEAAFLAARSLVALKQLSEAARLYRRAIRLAPSRLETAEIRLELAEVYLDLGQKGLAERLLQLTLRAELPGFMKLRAEALKLKSALGKRFESP